MKNDWLKRKEIKERRTADIKTLCDIDVVVENWQVLGTGHQRLNTILNTLATHVIEYLKPDLSPESRPDIHAAMVRGCMERVSKIDTTKHRSFNFFTTIMLGILRQHTTTARDMLKAKKEYREYIASRNSGNRDRGEA